MSNWIRVGNIDEFSPGSSHEIVIAGRIVALFRTDGGDFHALDGVCPHQGGPLGEGQLNGAVVTCPWHGWQFDVRDGQHQFNPTMCQPAFLVKLDGTDVWLNIGEQDS